MKGMKSGQKLPFSTSAMIPWTAEFVAQVLNEGVEEAGEKWTTEQVLSVARDNARVVYGI
jgi:TatD DNase family protein